MKIKFPVFLIILLFQLQIFAQNYTGQLIEASPKTVGVSAEKVAQIDKFIKSYVAENKIPGGEFLIARDGKIIYHSAHGYWTPEKTQAYENGNIYRLASMTKAFTTVAIMQLYEDGKLGLDDPIFYYIPAFAKSEVLDTYNEEDTTYTTVKVQKPITIRHLLTHTSGITYGSFNPGKIQNIYQKFDLNNAGLSRPDWTTEDLANNIAKVPLIFQPGTKYMYGLNMEVLGRIVEVASGMKLNNYFQENIFKPLGMTDTYFYLPESKHDRLVPCYTTNREKGIHIPENTQGLDLDYPKRSGRDHFAGGGGASGTAMDYAQFIQALLNDGIYNGVEILSRKTIDVMTSDQLITINKEGKGFSQVPGNTFGLGFRLYTEDAQGFSPKSPGTFEWGGYFNTKFFIDPAERLTFVGMTQIVPSYHPEFWDRLYAMIYSSLE